MTDSFRSVGFVYCPQYRSGPPVVNGEIGNVSFFFMSLRPETDINSTGRQSRSTLIGQLTPWVSRDAAWWPDDQLTSQIAGNSS